MRHESEHCPSHVPRFDIVPTVSEPLTARSFGLLKNSSPRLPHYLRRWRLSCVTTRIFSMQVLYRMHRKNILRPPPSPLSHNIVPYPWPMNSLLSGLPTSTG